MLPIHILPSFQSYSAAPSDVGSPLCDVYCDVYCDRMCIANITRSRDVYCVMCIVMCIADLPSFQSYSAAPSDVGSPLFWVLFCFGSN